MNTTLLVQTTARSTLKWRLTARKLTWTIGVRCVVVAALWRDGWVKVWWHHRTSTHAVYWTSRRLTLLLHNLVCIGRASRNLTRTLCHVWALLVVLVNWNLLDGWANAVYWTHLGLWADDWAHGCWVKALECVTAGEAEQFWVLWEQLGHALLETGNLGELAVVGLVLVEVDVEGFGLVNILWLLGKAVDRRLKGCTCV